MPRKKANKSVDLGQRQAVAVLRRLLQYAADGRSAEVTAATIPAALLKLLLGREWIDAAPGNQSSYRISELGRSALRRIAAGEAPFRAQHQVIRTRQERDAAGEMTQLSVNEAESPLGWLLNRPGRDGKTHINRDQFEAGERLRMDFTLAQMTPRVTAAWGLPVHRGARAAPSDPAAMADSVIAAKARFHKALDVVGPGLADVLVQTCCHLQGLEEAEKQLGWPARSGKVVLRIALDRLVAHYGLVSGGNAGLRARGKINLQNTQNNACQP